MKTLLLLLVMTYVLAASPAMAVSGKYDTSLPITINADNLEVDQQHQTAQFNGNVKAIQGDIELRSQTMLVYYRSTDSKASGTNAISKVKVSGNVVVTTPREVAKGNEGVYDVDKSTIQLDGQVTLTQGKNIIQGDKLLYNISTGKSEVLSTSGKEQEKAGSPKRRVRSVFIPEKKE